MWFIFEKKLGWNLLDGEVNEGKQSKSKDYKTTHAGVKNNFLYPS